MKASAYIHKTELLDGTCLFFNFYTLNLIELLSADARVAEGILQSPNEEPSGRKAGGLKKVLREKGFLLNDGLDERDHLRSFHEKACRQQKHLGLTILPSLACNLRCVYCYETRDAGVMGDEVQAAIVRLAQTRVQPGGSLAVTWFGGEPLLNLPIIERLSRSFMEICADRQAKYSASIITNGYLLDKGTAEALVELKVDHAQVTLDGPEAVHDARRPTAAGRGSFRRIFENLTAASPVLPVSLRINVDQTNRAVIPDVLDLIAAAGLQRSVHPYLGHTLPYNDVCQDVATSCIASDDFSLLDLETAFELMKRGFWTFSPPKSTNAYCLADNNNSFVVTPSGGLVNCWNDSADPSAEVGHLLKPPTDRMRSKSLAWLSRDPFALACLECLLLPICMGGCPYLYLKTGQLQCHRWKHHLDESIAFYHLVKKIENISRLAGDFRKIGEEIKALAARPGAGSAESAAGLSPKVRGGGKRTRRAGP